MASNVFGTPITDATLQAMPDYIGKEITATDRAHVALNMKNAENKDVNARSFVGFEKEVRQWRLHTLSDLKCYWRNSEICWPPWLVGSHWRIPVPYRAPKWSVGCLSSRQNLWSSYWIHCGLCVSWRKRQRNCTRLDAGMVQSMGSSFWQQQGKCYLASNLIKLYVIVVNLFICEYTTFRPILRFVQLGTTRAKVIGTLPITY